MDESLAGQIRERARWRCEYCQLPQAALEVPFEIEHIVPRQHGGKTTLTNLAYSCLQCNRHKGPNLAGIDRPTSSNRLVRLFHPRRHKWERHFRWAGPFLVRRTAIGRVTVTVLDLNNPIRLELRALLIAEGVFPPKPLS